MTIDDLLATDDAALDPRVRARDLLASLRHRPDFEALYDKHASMAFDFACLIDSLFRTEALAERSEEQTLSTCTMACIALLILGETG